MTAKYFAILTNQGAARLANAAALGTTLNITQMAVGDANGVLPTPDPAQTALINQKRIASLNMLSIDPNNSSQIIAEQVIPENEGGYWIREIGLYDDSGVLVAVANCPETYKPLLQEGSGRTQTIRMVLIVSSTSAVTLKIDPAVVLATRQYVDNKVIEVKAYADNLLSQHIAASNPHTQYAPIASPTFTGTPKAPTAAQTANDTQLATTAFVKAAIAALVNGAPATLDTLAELATALGNNPNFSTTVTNTLAGKQPLDNTLSALSGKSVAALLEYLGLGTAAKKDMGTGTGQLPSMSSFTTNYDGGSAYQINWPSTVTGKNGSSLQLQSALVNLSPGYQVVTLPFVVPTQAIFCDISIDAGSTNPGAAIGAGLSDFNKIRLVNFGSTGTTVRYYCWCV